METVDLWDMVVHWLSLVVSLHSCSVCQVSIATSFKSRGETKAGAATRIWQDQNVLHLHDCLFSIVPHKNKRANSGTDGGLAELIHTCVSLHSVTALLIKLVHLMDWARWPEELQSADSQAERHKSPTDYLDQAEHLASLRLHDKPPRNESQQYLGSKRDSTWTLA